MQNRGAAKGEPVQRSGSGDDRKGRSPKDGSVLAVLSWMLITPDEARRIAASIAKLLTPLKRRHVAKATHGAGMIEFHGA